MISEGDKDFDLSDTPAPAEESAPAIGELAKRDAERERVEQQKRTAYTVGRRRQRRTNKLRLLSPLQLPPDWEVRSLNEPDAPRTRADCAAVVRPCPYVNCRSHLWLRLKQEQAGNPQAGKQGDTTFRPSTMQSCSLDVAERGASFDEIGAMLGIDSTRARQIAQAGLEKLKALGVDVDKLLEAL